MYIELFYYPVLPYLDKRGRQLSWFAQARCCSQLQWRAQDGNHAYGTRHQMPRVVFEPILLAQSIDALFVTLCRTKHILSALFGESTKSIIRASPQVGHVPNILDWPMICRNCGKLLVWSSLDVNFVRQPQMFFLRNSSSTRTGRRKHSVFWLRSTGILFFWSS